MGFVLEVAPTVGGAPMAVGCVDALELDDGQSIAHTQRMLGLILLDSTAPADVRPLHAHLGDAMIVNVFRARGLDLAWAQRRASLELRERCLPVSAPLWLGGVAQRQMDRRELEIGASATHPLLVSTLDPRAVRRSRHAREQLRALRHDALLDALVKNAIEEPALFP